MGKIFLNKLLVCLFCFSFIFLSSIKTQSEAPPFEELFRQWLYSMGFKGEVLELHKIYDDDGFLDYFKIQIKEDYGIREEPPRTEAKIHFELAKNDSFEFVNIKLIEKDLKGIPYMYADWIARMVVSTAVQKISKTLGLDYKIKKVRGGLYRATIEPSKTAPPSRFRFDQIEIFYEIKDLILSLDGTIKGPADYIALNFVRSELNAVLRALENGHFPEGATAETIASELARGSGSDYLLHGILKTEEAYREIVSKPESIPLE